MSVADEQNNFINGLRAYFDEVNAGDQCLLDSIVFPSRNTVGLIRLHMGLNSRDLETGETPIIKAMRLACDDKTENARTGKLSLNDDSGYDNPTFLRLVFELINQEAVLDFRDKNNQTFWDHLEAYSGDNKGQIVRALEDLAARNKKRSLFGEKLGLDQPV